MRAQPRPTLARPREPYTPKTEGKPSGRVSERRGETKPLRARVGERGARRAAHPVSRTDTRACAKCSEGELRRTTRPPRRRRPNTCLRKGTSRLTSSRRPGSPNSHPQTISKSGCSPRRELGVLEVVMPWKAARAGVSDEQDTRHFTQNGRIAPVRTCDWGRRGRHLPPRVQKRA